MSTPRRPVTGLPEGLAHRPLRADEAHAVWELVAAEERADRGAAEVEEADIVADWQRPSFDVAASTVGIFDGDTLVAFAQLEGGERGEAAVLPGYRRRGIGTALAAWLRETARDRGETLLRSPVFAGGDGDRLLERLGYRVAFTSWVLELPVDAEVPHRTPPPGFVSRTATEQDYRTVNAVIEDAFGEWRSHRESFEDFEAGILRRPGFEPWQIRVVTEPGGEVVAAAVTILAEHEDGSLEAYIDSLATRADHRGRGLGQALMVESFATGREHGATRFGLATDDRGSALSLYEKVGLRVVDTWFNRAVDL